MLRLLLCRIPWMVCLLPPPAAAGNKMMLRIQTQEHIKSLNDVDLVEYSRDSDYEPEAIAFSFAEIQRRNLNLEQQQQMQIIADQPAQSREIERAAAAMRPLAAADGSLHFLPDTHSSERFCPYS